MSNSNDNTLIDSFGRQVRYLRLSVTDRCNLRCTYCMAEDMTFLPKAKLLSFEEMHLIAHAFVELGVQKIRLTGGEPLVRKGVVALAQSLTALNGLRELVMTTNGVLLSQYALPLKQAGIDRLNISIDSLNALRFNKLTRFGELDDVLQGIKAAQQAGFKRLKLNAVIQQGINDDEVVALAQFAIDQGCDISFIEEMPLGEAIDYSRSKSQVTSRTIREQLEHRFTLRESPSTDPMAGPARYLKIADTNTKVGFISPMSNNFCGSCNRVRLTVEGQLLLCLGNEHSVDLRQVVRETPNDIEVLKQVISQSMQRKPERHYFDPNDIKITRYMSATGG